MKRIKVRMKKGIARLLAAIMIVGLLAMMPYNMATVYAASTPSPTVYATKQELMGWNHESNVGKIVFGKDSDGNPLEWYILGNDSGVQGDNTVIFAASPIATNTPFENDWQNKKTYDAAYGVYTSAPITIWPNHYGASDLRVTLNEMVASDNATYFTSAEKSLLQATTVTTKDAMNNVAYTTSDVLYALQGDFYNNTTLYAGSNNGKELQVSPYWSSGAWFWLRTPYVNRIEYALVVYTGSFVYCDIVSNGGGVRPASNLNLSSAIFASAAQAAPSEIVEAGTIPSDKAMTLRLDGSSMNIGNVIYDSAGGEMIYAKKSSQATGTVSLVVQGNDGTNDWYYSKAVAGAEIIRMDEIKTALNLSDDISVNDCKIWLETAVDGVTYAKELTNGSCVSAVDLTMDAPVAGSVLDTQAGITQLGITTTTPAVTWKDGTADVTGNADYGTAYTAYTTLEATDTSFFASSVTAKVNGNPATVVTNNDGTITVSYTFPATEEKEQLLSITQPQSMTVANGTAYADMNLPTMVTIETDKGNVTSAEVTWNTTAPIDGSYDPAVLTEQTVTLAGTVTCPVGVDANGVTLETKIAITISAAGITGAPAVNLAAGTYTENQMLSLSTTTDGATIYYTTDGTVPSRTNGTAYTTPISVTGIKGQSVDVTIKVIVVKDGMQDSAVETFTYTICLPADTEIPPADTEIPPADSGTVESTPRPDEDDTITDDEHQNEDDEHQNEDDEHQNTDDTTMEDETDKVPHTGDTSSRMIPFILIMVSLLCISMFIVYDRIEKKYE